MTKMSEKVKSWRKRTKERMVEAFGNECCLCKQQLVSELYDFHHIDPNKKEFGLGAARGSIKSWQRLVNELRKCVMLCANCHRLIEYGYEKIPTNAKRFNESFVTYKAIRKESKKL